MSDTWSLAITQPQRESVVAEFLARREYAFHWFRERCTIARNGRLINGLRPLFPAYIFVRARQDWELLRERTKIIGFVHFGAQFAFVGDRIVEDLLLACPDGIAPQREIPCRFKHGDQVDIIGTGPFSGHRAVFLRTISTDRSVVWVDIFGRSVPVSVETECLLDYIPGASRKKWRQRRRRRTRAWHEAREARIEQAGSHIG